MSVRDVTVEIAVGAPVTEEIPGRLAPIPVELVFTRALEAREGERDATVLDSVRTELDASLEATATLANVVEGSTVEVRFLSASGAVRLVETVTPAADGSAAVTLDDEDVRALTAAEPQPPAELSFVARAARLVPAGSTSVPFASSTLQVAWIDAASWAASGAGQVLGGNAPSTVSVELAGPLAADVTALGWRPTQLGVDGSFTALVPRKADVVWLWWLSGPHAAVGAVVEDLTAVLPAPLVVVLPPFALPPTEAGAPEAGRRGVPADVSETELADNPDVYAEDPGAFCRPFSNPERVLGERAFNVIVRAEQPAISVEPSLRTHMLTTLEFEQIDVAPDREEREERRVRGGLFARRLRPAADEGAAREAREREQLLEADGFASVVRHRLPTGYLDLLRRAPRVRSPLDGSHPVDWEGDASRYQAATVARGHIIEFRARWRANGYSLGTVAKTLTLAPRQVKRIQKIEWERVERARREERTAFVESASSELEREREYSDAVEASLSEWARGESRSSMSAGAAGAGFALGGFVIGGGGVHSSAGSSSSQQGGRRTSAAEEQRLRDAIRQFAESRRQLESVVVNEVSQEESVTGTVETVRNPNYAHSLTIIYYQILRHLKLQTELGGVRECLFVPFAIRPFTIARAYRWRESIGRGLRDRRYGPALRFLRDVLTGFVGSRVPPGPRSQQPVRHVSGSIYLTLGVERPKEDDEGEYDDARWQVIRALIGAPAYEIFAQVKRRTEAQRDSFFQSEYAPTIAAAWADGLRLQAGSTPLEADFTLATRYAFNGTVRVDFSAPVAGFLTRQLLTSMRVRATRSLPPGSTANVTGMSLTYQTDHYRRTVAVATGANDLVSVETGVVDPQGAALSAPLDTWESANEREEMTRAVGELVEHLNEHVEHYHKVVWWNMDRDRLFMLVDGFLAPGTNGMSVASVVEREPVAIVGNSLVYRVSAGSFLGLGDLKTPAQLHNYYAEHQLPGEPMYVSLPTDGLYAQAIMDECVALEEHYGSLDWVLDDAEPELGAIAPELLGSRATTPADTRPTPFPQTLINLQNAPEAPTPAGLADALAAVTRADAFRDMAGLAGTQANARAAMEAAANLATSFGAKAVELRKAAMATENANRKLASIKKAEENKLIEPEEAKRHANRALEEMNVVPPTEPKLTKEPAIEQALLSGRPFETSRTDADGVQTVAFNGGDAATLTPASLLSLIPNICEILRNIKQHWEAVRQEMVRLAEHEFQVTWTNGTSDEADAAMLPIVERYWRDGIFAGGAIPAWVNVPATAWSGAFISWLAGQAGGGDRFGRVDGEPGYRFGVPSAHRRYTAAAKLNADMRSWINPFWAFRWDETAPQVGDIVVKSRANSQATWENLVPQAPHRETHGDIVVAVAANQATVIGGNVGGAVDRSFVPLDANGRLQTTGGANDDHFAIVRIVTDIYDLPFCAPAGVVDA